MGDAGVLVGRSWLLLLCFPFLLLLPLLLLLYVAVVAAAVSQKSGGATFLGGIGEYKVYRWVRG
jgi:hypothetical protein